MLQDENNRFDITRTKEITDLQGHIERLFERMNGGESGSGVNDGIIKELSLSSEKGIRFSVEQRILKFLRFEAMDYRYLTVQPAHQGTFSWIREPTTFNPDPQVFGKFLDWLKSDDNTYWILGKIGSGKSTLMKCLCEQEIVRSNLKLWAGADCQLVLASFFFWNAGRLALQKSQEGLLRYILCQILRQCPNLIPHAYPDQWDAYTSSGGLKTDDFNQGYLTVLELLAAIQRIFAQVATAKIRFCFFIDGIDEYDGKPDDIIRLVELLKFSRHVKICVSSRPWNEFEKAFGGDDLRQLRIQDLTRNDIELFVRDTLENDASFQELKEDDVDLIQEIVNRAGGVFLWVRLVVRSLLEGVTNADRVVDLQSRLRSFPTDLYKYFERELFSVDNFYRQKTARFFQVTLAAREIIPLMSYWFVDQDEPGHAIKLEVKSWILQKINIRLGQMKKRLNACCKGLLEVQLYDDGGDDSSLSSSILFNLRVDFSHRTVWDFLRTSDIQNLLNKWTSSEFDADIVICEAMLGQIKTSPQEKEYFADNGPISKLIATFQSHVGGSRDVMDTNLYRSSLIKELSETLHRHGHRIPVGTSDAIDGTLQTEA